MLEIFALTQKGLFPIILLLEVKKHLKHLVDCLRFTYADYSEYF